MEENPKSQRQQKHQRRNLLLLQFKTFPKKEVKIFKLFPKEDEKVRELRDFEIKNEEFKAVLRELKNDIDRYRGTPSTRSFCSTIYNYIEGIL